MVIRFHCPACNQPIEVDEQWATRLVGCPYCRKTVTAPAESNLSAESIPTATPIGASAAPFAQSAPARGGNALAVAALILTVATMAMLLTASVVYSNHSLEIAEIDRELRNLGADASPMKAAMEYARLHGGQFPTWALTISLLTFGALLSCISGLICGLVAMRRSERRAAALLSVFGCGGLLLWTTVRAALG